MTIVANCNSPVFTEETFGFMHWVELSIILYGRLSIWQFYQICEKFRLAILRIDNRAVDSKYHGWTENPIKDVVFMDGAVLLIKIKDYKYLGAA